MIVSSSAGLLSKKTDNQTLSNILLRTDGFKNVFRGLTYKHSTNKNTQASHAGTYTSIGKRTPAKEYHFTKDAESKLDGEEDRSKQFRRTQTAEIATRSKGDCREK